MIEKPKVEEARWLRDIYFIDPDNAEIKETIMNAQKKDWARSRRVSTKKIATNVTFTIKNMYTLWRPTNLQQSVAKGLKVGDYEDPMAGMGFNSGSFEQ